MKHDSRTRWRLVLLGLLLSMALGPQAVSAHFNLNTNIRIVHIERLDDGIRLYMRLPAPLALARFIPSQDQSPDEGVVPYVHNRTENGRLVHYVDIDALEDDPRGLGRIVLDGHRLSLNGAELQGKVKQVRVHTAELQPRFATLQEAIAAFDGPAYTQPAYVGDTVVDVVALYAAGQADGVVSLASTLKPPAEEEETVLANLLIDHTGGETHVYRVAGTLSEPFALGSSALGAFLTFTAHGFRHILEGVDHVLFVLCLTIGAATLGALLWRVTGFTIGHSITLAAGFFGYAPDQPWFIPVVETAISVSIIYVAVVALMPRVSAATFSVTAAIGLLHGFGFSFVLSEILSPDGPNLLTSLFAFNVGVELGQAGIVLAVWPLMYLVGRKWPRTNQPLRMAIAVPCIAVAALWTGQRMVQLFTAS
ncbi:MAG: HupE/UreJ family protein [Gammaproteobacteria bacterium]